MNPEEEIAKLEQFRNEIISFTDELDEKLEKKEIDGIEYYVLLHERFKGKSKNELLDHIDQQLLAINQQILADESKEKIRETKKSGNLDHTHEIRRRTALTFGAAAIIIIIIALAGVFGTYQGSLTGYTTAAREAQETVEYNRIFEHYTETMLDLTNITSLRISGSLEGTGATVKLRIDNVEYLVANLTNQQEQDLITGLVIDEAPTPAYTLSTDKTEYALGETAYITLEPGADNKSLYVSYGEETHILDQSIYVTQNLGEHQVIALIVLPDDILRLETNFTVINGTSNLTENATTNETVNQTVNETFNETTNETANATGTYTFTDICIGSCNIPETTYPVLIVELEENSKLTITQLTVIKNKENEAPVQTKNIPDITITTAQTATVNLDDYFTDPDNDTLHYDINEIPEINANIDLDTLTISSNNMGTYTAYIYTTDGDKLTTSNTFQIKIILPTNATTNTTETNISEYPADLNITPPTNETINQTINVTINGTPPETVDPCSQPDLNQRPSYCFIGIEEKVFQDLSAEIENRRGAVVGRFTRFGNLVITGLLIQNATGTPDADDFKIGFTTRTGFDETQTYTAWIDSATGNLYLRGRLYDEQEILDPPQFNTYIIQNRFGIILGYFDELTGDLYLKGNLVQLGKI